jgi:Flp pilus assembly secretin CpaC
LKLLFADRGREQRQLARTLTGWVFAGVLTSLPAFGAQLAAQSAGQSGGAGTVAAQPAVTAKAPAAVSGRERDLAQQAYVHGAKAVEQKDLKAALGDFQHASALEPSNTNYTTALSIVRQNLVTQLVQQYQKARLLGDKEQARALLAEAEKVDAGGATHNPMLAQHATEMADLEHEERPEQALLEPLPDDAGAPVELEPKTAKQSFHMMAARDQVIKQVLAAYGITAFIDKSVTSVDNARVHYDQDDVSFAEARNAAELATDTFLVPLDPHRVLVALDTKENRLAFERIAQETIYLPGLTSAEMSDLGNVARNVFLVEKATVDESAHTMVVRAAQSKLKPLNLMLTELMDGRSEVMLDVDFYEVSRERTVNQGAEIPTSSNVFNVTSEVDNLITANPTLVQQIISSGLASPGNIGEIALALVLSGQAGSTLLSQPFATFGGGITTTGLTLTSATANANLNLSDTRMLDQVQLRLLDQEEGTIQVGERYPIVTSSYSNLATGSTSIAGISSAGLSNTLSNLGVNLASLSSAASASVPQVQYQDLGLTLHATSRVEHAQDVALKLDLVLTSLAGASLNSNPVLNNRQYTSQITLKPGERAVVVSSLNNQETSTLIGLPFLSEIPGFEFGTNVMKDKTTDTLVIVITPRVVRMSHRMLNGPMVLLPQHS